MRKYVYVFFHLRHDIERHMNFKILKWYFQKMKTTWKLKKVQMFEIRHSLNLLLTIRKTREIHTASKVTELTLMPG